MEIVSSMRNQLLGYLLGALEPDEQRAVENELDRDPKLRRELAVLGESLETLEVDDEYYTPPPGLATRTCRFVGERTVTLASGRTGAGAWQLQDMFVAAGVLIAAAMLFFPAVNHSRFAARVAGCRHNLQVVGHALLQYAEINGGYFPFVPQEGKLAVAGVYGPTLSELKFVNDDSLFRCPADESRAGDRATPIPNRDDVLAATGKRLRALQSSMGGSYAFVVGYVDDGEYRGQRLEASRKSRFPLLADGPGCSVRGLPSTYHDGTGQNVFFDDGHVDFLAECTDCETNDHIYVNTLGEVGAGTDIHDAVLGGSGACVGLFD